jgi:tRNA dimethylallyltransferase
VTRLKVATIVGPTATGKSELAVEVAECLGAEIVSVDSMKIYKGMDAGTAKPPPDLLGRVPHHLIDEIDPAHSLTVAEFQALGRSAIEDIARRGCVPLLVGGSGLYYRAIVDDLVFPPTDEKVRSTIESEAEELGAEGLHARLHALDERAAAKIEPGNIRRMVRALEVIELTGRPFSENSAAWDRYESRYDLRAAGLGRVRAELRERVAARVDQMLAAGLIDEARELNKRGPLSRTARMALGYRQVLDAGEDADVSEVRESIVRATVRFARRQEAWFRADPRIVWFDASRPDLLEAVTPVLSEPHSSSRSSSTRKSMDPSSSV